MGYGNGQVSLLNVAACVVLTLYRYLLYMKKKPVVTVTRKLTERVETRLAQYFDVRLNPDDAPLSSTQLMTAMQASDALVCTVSDVVSREVLLVDRRRVSMIANVGVGYSNIDIASARQADIVVSNTPDVLTDATADIAMLLILAATRRAYEAESMLRQGQWQGFSVSTGLGMSIQGKVLGVIGMGRIGQALARRAALGFGMEVIYYNRSAVTNLDFPAQACADVDEVMSHSDVVSLHIPGTPQGPVIAKEQIDKMKSGAFLINTARGDVLDERALINALCSDRIAGAGLDVYTNEPHVPKELLALSNVTLLPHIGSATLEVRDAMGMLAVDNLIAHFEQAEYPSRVV